MVRCVTVGCQQAQEAAFDTALEVTLDEIRIELLSPLDDVAERFSAAGTSSGRSAGT